MFVEVALEKPDQDIRLFQNITEGKTDEPRTGLRLKPSFGLGDDEVERLVGLNVQSSED